MSEPKPTNPVDEIKWIVYLRTVQVGLVILPVLYLVFYLDGSMTSFDWISFPILFVIVLGSYVSFNWLGKAFIRFHERLWFSIVLLYYVSQFFYQIYEISQGRARVMGDYMLWISVYYLLAFIIFPSEQAIRWSVLYLMLMFAIGIYFGAVDWSKPVFNAEISMVAQITLAGLVNIALLNAISSLKKSYNSETIRSELMETIANQDDLTGIFNRRKIRSELEASVLNSRSTRSEMGVILMDVDDLKGVNDRFGHNFGDNLLREIVQVLEDNLRDEDSLGRWGGDEFLILIPDADQAGAEQIADRLEAAVSEHSFGGLDSLTISAGAASLEAGETVDRLIQRADDAMYRRKKERRALRSSQGFSGEAM